MVSLRRRTVKTGGGWRRGALRALARRGRAGLLLTLLLFLVAIYVSTPLPDPLFDPDYSTVVLDERGRILRMFLNGDEQWRFPHRANADVPHALEAAVLCFEDRRFYRHPGVDPLALLRAVYQNIRAGEVVSGASTLTMQVARMTSPKKRTYINKALEMVQALKIEIHYDKKQILNLYLDHAPYGGNVVGYRAAAHRYFGKSAERLTWGEAATLAVLPNAPGLISPLADPDKLRLRRDRLLSRLRNEGTIDTETLGLARLEAVPDGAMPLPMDAPHLARRLASRHRSTYLRTTLRRDIQKQSAKLVNRHAAFMRRLGVRNGAALVVETRTGEVRAYVGSQGFFRRPEPGPGGRRCGRTVLRISSQTVSVRPGHRRGPPVAPDAGPGPAHALRRFLPGNADGTYAGLVAAKEALVRSLNVPAVRLLDAYGMDAFYGFLKSAGLTTLFRSSGDYGLPMILGGVEVSLWDMAQCYRALANGRALRSPQGPGRNARSGRSLAHQSRRMLSDTRRASGSQAPRRGILLASVPEPVADRLEDGYQLRKAGRLGRRRQPGVDGGGLDRQFRRSRERGPHGREFGRAPPVRPVQHAAEATGARLVRNAGFRPASASALRGYRIPGGSGLRASGTRSGAATYETPPNLSLPPDLPGDDGRSPSRVFALLATRGPSFRKAACLSGGRRASLARTRTCSGHGSPAQSGMPGRDRAPAIENHLPATERQAVACPGTSAARCRRSRCGWLTGRRIAFCTGTWTTGIWGAAADGTSKPRNSRKGWHTLDVVDEIGNRDRKRFFVDMRHNGG